MGRQYSCEPCLHPDRAAARRRSSHRGKTDIGLELLILLLLANGAPILAARLTAGRLSYPVDGGRVWPDGRRLLGPSKSWRGLMAGITTTTVVAWPLGVPPALGAAVGALSLGGDLLSSFLKRRLGIPPSGRATGLDQIPEALLPAVVLAPALEIGPWEVLGVVAAFFALGLVLSWAGFRLGLRTRPY